VFYIKLFLLLIWLILTSILGVVYSILRWGNTNINRDYARLFAWGALRILRIEVQVEGKEYLESSQPCIYVVNHQSGLDMATLGNIYPQRTIVIGKKEVILIPFFGIFYIAAGNILIDRSKTVKAVAGLKQAVETIHQKKVSIWIFPEGTRNRLGDGLLPFKRGAFHMAVQAQVPLVPIVCGPLSELAHWKKRKLKGGRIRVRVLPPISTKNIQPEEVDELTQNTREKMLEAFHSLGSNHP
jgi:1-acyl-sn-glycerol-3-phosphate acyltransferase